MRKIESSGNAERARWLSSSAPRFAIAWSAGKICLRARSPVTPKSTNSLLKLAWF